MTHHCGRKSKWYNVHFNQPETVEQVELELDRPPTPPESTIQVVVEEESNIMPVGTGEQKGEEVVQPPELNRGMSEESCNDDMRSIWSNVTGTGML